MTLDPDGDVAIISITPNKLFKEHGHVDIAEDDGAGVGLLEHQVWYVHVSKFGAAKAEVEGDVTLIRQYCLLCSFGHASAYHFNDEWCWILQRDCGVEVESVDWWVEKVQACYVEGALGVYEI